MTAKELVQAVEADGGHIRVDGSDLVITPRSVAAPLRAQLIEHKQEMVGFLSVRQQVPEGVRLIRWEPEQPPIQLSRSETVIGVVKFVSTTLAQLDAELYGHCWLAGNWTVEVLLARLEALGCIVLVE
jgi:hypothetical protein